MQNNKLMDIFIHKPILSIVLSLLICFAGLWAIKSISVQQFPKIESASLIINTTYTGASAKVVKGFISEPIERVAATVPGVEYVESMTKAGQSTVTAWLKLNNNSTAALAELTARLSQVQFELPAEAQDPVVSVKRTDRPFALFYLNIENDNVSLSKLTDYLNREVTPVINSIDGVQKAEIEGGRIPAMKVWLNADRMSMVNVSADEVYTALANNNAIATLGYTETNKQRIDIVSNTQVSSIVDFENLIVKHINDKNIYLKDVAKIELASEAATVTARLNQNNTAYIAVWPLPGANEIDVGDRLYQVIDEINPRLPQGLKINFAYDGTLYMRDALKEIITTLIETVVLVGIVVLLLMGSFRTALVPLITIPISILGAIAAMYLIGFSLNLLTVLAIVLSVGLVVDDAIVVVENVARHMRNGVSRTQAALMSSRQLFLPIISMTLTLAMVYAPIGFLSGLTGILFREFAFTLAIAVTISGIVAITLSPIMSAHFSPKGGEEGALTKKVNHIFDLIQQFYTRLLNKSIHWQGQIILIAFVIALVMIPFYLDSSKELAPVEDQSQIFVVIQSPPESSLEYNERNMTPIVDDLLTIEGTNQMWQNIFTSGGFGGLEFTDKSHRDFTTMEMIPQVYGRLSNSAGLNPLPILPASLPTAGQFDIEFIVKSSAPYEEMKQYADKLVGAAFQSGEFLYADTDLKIDLPQIELALDRQIIADLGMNISEVSNQLSIYLSNNYVNRFDAEGKAYQVIPIANSEISTKPESILSLNIKSPSNELIPVSAFATLKWITVPRQLSTFGQQNSFRIYGGIAPNTTKETALVALEQAAKEILPHNYNIDYAGESRQLRQEGNSFIGVMLVSLCIVYLVLAIQFNSFRDPLVVLLGCVPLALSGALLIPYLEFTTINIYSQIGLVTLIGLIAKNGILIVEFANHLQDQGKDKISAIIGSAATRLRPILMTTAATVLGHFPLVLVTGAGAEARNSIGIILVAGMLIGTIFTLFVLPVFYLWLAKDQNTTIELQDIKPTNGLIKPVLANIPQ
ncbi:efflux RND transporter permease subunit [uncultured Shewanella sp.]|uniref:efflux RND transporter permease subunit n=1 Tax=uncultured Shewanella sp. TaxID=173975 RepID=UPI0026022D8C|nr:efflux RND transporter permease subunit [uncultured Shewanella sp.]